MNNVAAFFERYHVRLFDYAYRMLTDREEAEDILQEIFLRAIQKKPSYGSETGFRKWCYKVATNLAIDRIRRHKKRRGYSLEEATDDGEEKRSLRETLRDSGAGPDEMAGRAELARRLERAVGELPEKERQVFLLRQNANLSFREIAEIRGEPLNTVLSRMRRAMQRLRRSLEGSETFLGGG